MATVNDPNTAANIAAVKAASTAPVATDCALVVSESPNSASLAKTVVGNKTNNNTAPGATNVGALVVVGNAAAPSITEGNLAALSTDLAGTLRTELTKVAGTATSTAAAGVQKVGVVGNAGGAFDAATAAAVPANALHLGGKAATANPTNATAGNLTPLMVDKAGRLVVTSKHVRELIGVQQTALAASTETTFITAGSAGVFNDLTALIITTAGAAAATLTIKDATGGTTRMILNYPNATLAPGAALVLNFDPPIPQASSAANWTVTNSVATATNITAVFVKNL